MQRRNFQRRSGVIVDWCRGHGTWLDADELEAIAGYIVSGGTLTGGGGPAAGATADIDRTLGDDRQARTARIGAAGHRPRPWYADTPSSSSPVRSLFRLLDVLLGRAEGRGERAMGFFEKLRAELVDIVEWVDDGHDAVVSRIPRYHNQIKYGAQLIVRPGQQAVVVHQGRIADVFGPGQYTLETRNLPVLSTLAGWKHGFDSPFKAEVYFVRTTEVTDLEWATPNPVMMRDPDFGPVRVCAFGGYTLKATNPRALMQALVGTTSASTPTR